MNGATRVTTEYDYEAVDGTGHTIKGRLQAESPADVVRRLSYDGHTVVGVSEHRPSVLPRIQRRPRGADVVTALHELATLLESGVGLREAVLAQSRGSYHPGLANAFEAIAKELMRGHSFLAAVRSSDLPVPDYVYQLIEAGEMSGRLSQSLRETVEQMRYDLRVGADIRGALTYPAILAVAGMAAVMFVFVFVVPQFANILDGDSELPLLAVAVLSLGIWFNANAWSVVGVLAGVVLVGVVLMRRQRVRAVCTDALAMLPVVGGWFSEVDTGKWASVMGAMLASRVELMDALALASRGVRISRRQSMLRRAIAEVKGGSALSEALEKQHALTPTGYNLIRVGEQSGQLAEMMRALAAIYEESSARRMKRVLTLIEPLAILLIGSVLGTIMIGLILAITSVHDIDI